MADNQDRRESQAPKKEELLTRRAAVKRIAGLVSGVAAGGILGSAVPALGQYSSYGRYISIEHSYVNTVYVNYKSNYNRYLSYYSSYRSHYSSVPPPYSSRYSSSR
jgi:hypothetical protein